MKNPQQEDSRLLLIISDMKREEGKMTSMLKRKDKKHEKSVLDQNWKDGIQTEASHNPKLLKEQPRGKKNGKYKQTRTERQWNTPSFYCAWFATHYALLSLNC